MNRQYIGARYVPKIFSDETGSTQWRNDIPYEPLTIVTNLGNSYTSKKPVPVGVEINDDEYWALTGNYNAQVQHLTEIVDKQQAAVNNLDKTVNLITSSYITPEMFGAKGDGVTDDTLAFKKMLIADNVKWKLDGNKTYTVSTFSITNKIIIEGNGATIKSTEPITIDITLEKTNYYSSYDNIVFDGGLNIVKGSQMYITNCVFKNARNGISYSNKAKETFITKCRIADCLVGIYSDGSDVEVSYITIRDCQTALLVLHSSTFSNVHAWLSKDFVGSKFADCNADATFYKCFPDTYQYGFYVNKSVYLRVYDVFCLRNTSYWDDAAPQYLLYSPDNNYFNHTFIEGGAYIGDNLHNYYLSNYATLNVICCKGLDVARYIKNVDTNFVTGITLQAGSVIRNNNNSIIINGNLITISATIEFTGNSTSEQKIASISKSIAPSSKIITSCGVADGDGATYNAFRNLSNLIIDTDGSITVRNGTPLSGKLYAGIFVTFVGKNKNYIS